MQINRIYVIGASVVSPTLVMKTENCLYVYMCVTNASYNLFTLTPQCTLHYIPLV